MNVSCTIRSSVYIRRGGYTGYYHADEPLLSMMREISLFAGLHDLNQLLLGQRTVETAQVAFDFPETADFVAQLHMHCGSRYLYRNPQ